MRLGFVLLTVATVASASLAGDYQTSGRLVYHGTYPLGTWQGTNTAMTGKVTWDAASGALTGAVQATVAAWDSGNKVRDAHGRIMFEAEKFPTAHLALAGLKEPRANGAFVVRGVLTLHGVTGNVEIPGTLQTNGKRVVFDGALTLRLTEYGMKQPKLLGMEVANEVKLQIHAEGTTP